MADQQITLDIKATNNIAQSVKQLEALGVSLRTIQTLVNKGALSPATSTVYRPLKGLIDDVTALNLQYKQLSSTSRILGAGGIGNKTQFISQAQGLASLRGETEKFVSTVGRFEQYKDVLGAFTSKGFPAYANRTGAFGAANFGPENWNLSNAQSSFFRDARQSELESVFNSSMKPVSRASLFGGGGGGVGTTGGAGEADRFNFGQIFTGFMALGGFKAVNDTIAQSVNKFAELEATLKKVQIVMKPTDVSMSDLRDTILDLSKALPFSINEISQASITIAQAGVKNLGELRSTLLTTSIIALRFGDDLQTTALNLITTANEFGIPLANLAKIANVMSTVSGDTVANIKELGSAFGQVGPGAKELGISIDETAVSLGVARDVAISASRAGTNLRNLFTQLEKISEGVGSARQRNVLEKYGLTLQDVNIKTQGYTPVLQKLASVHMGLADAQELVQQRNGILLLALINSARGTDFASSKFGILLDRVKKGTDLFKDLEQQLGTTKANQVLFQNSVDRLQISIGETFGIFLNIVRPALVGFIDAITNIPGPIKAIILVFTSLLLLMTAAGLLIPVMAKSISGELVGAFNLLKTAVVSILPNLAAFFVEILPAAVGLTLLAYAVDDFTKHLKAGNNPLQSFNAALIDSVYWIARTGLEFQKAAVLWTNNKFFDDSIKKLGAIRDAAKAGLGIKEPAKDATGAVTDLSNKLNEMMSSLIGSITNADIAEKLKAWWKEASHFTDEIEKAKDATEIFQYRVKSMAIQSQEDFQKLIDGMIPTWSDAIFQLIHGTKTFGDVWQEVMDYSLRKFIDGFLEGMMGSFDQAMGKMTAEYLLFSQTTGQNVGGGTGKGIGGIFGAIGSAVSLASGFGGAFGAPILNPMGGNYPAMAEGGIVTKPTFGLIGESGPEAVIPLDRLGSSNKSQNITVINVVDRNFVHQTLSDDPDVIINSINADLIRNGTTRKTIKRYTQ